MSIKLFSVFLTLLFLPFLASANTHGMVVLDSLDTPLDLAPFIETIEDTNHEYTVEDIQAGRHEQLWKRSQKSLFVGPNIKSKYWFRVTIHWQGKSETDAVLYIDSPPILLHRLSLILPPGEGKEERIVHTGSRELFESRELPALQYAFPYKLASGEPLTIIGWAHNSETSVPIQLPFVLTSERDFSSANQIYNGILISFYTLTFALFIYNFCLYITLKQKVYGFYLIFLTSAVLACALLDGSASRYFLQSNPQLLSRISIVNGVFVASVYLIFVASALEDLRYWPSVNKIITGTWVIGMMCCIHNLFTNDLVIGSAVVVIYSAITYNLTLLIIIFAMTKRLPTAGYLLVAELIMITGGTCFVLFIQGAAVHHPITLWGDHWGLASEALLLSLALAARTRIAQQDKIIAEAKNEAKTQFFASMSHELRTPLTAILGYSESGQDLELSNEEKINHFRSIHRGGSHLLELINDILDLSKIEAQKIEIENIQVELLPLLDEINDTFNLLAHNKDLAFTVNCHYPLPAFFRVVVA